MKLLASAQFTKANRAILTTVLVLVTGSVSARDVFFVTGQSNAKPEFSQGVEETLRASGHFPDLKVVAVRRSGKGMNGWYGTEPNELYRRDFFSDADSPPALLESAMLEDDGGHTFRALFWFQGESDFKLKEVEKYAERFSGMLDQLSADLGHATPFETSGMRYHLALVDSTHPIVVTDLIRAEQQRMVAAHSAFAGLSDTREFVRPDGLHMMTSDLYELGRRMANEYLEAVGLTPVVFEHDWTGAEENSWARTGNWERGIIPTSEPKGHFARFGRVAASRTDLFLNEPASIDGLVFSNSAGQSSWLLAGDHPLTVTDTVDARGVNLEIQLPCLGDTTFKGRDSKITFSGSWNGSELHLGSHGLPGNHYRIREANWLAGATGRLNLGSAKEGTTGGTRIDLEADQTTTAPVRIYGGSPEDGAESLVTLKAGVRWLHKSGAYLHVGDSNTSGSFWSSGRLLVEEGGELKVLGGSAVEIGYRGGMGRIDIQGGLLRIERAFQEPFVLGGATFNDSANSGEGGSGEIRLLPGGIVETARGLRSRIIFPADQAPVTGQGKLRLMGGTLRLIDDGGTGGELDLLGSENAQTDFGPVSVEVGAGWSTIDTNGYDAVSHVPFSGEGGWTKTGEGTLRFSGSGEIMANVKILEGEVVFDQPLIIPEGRCLELRGGTLRCPELVNEGTLFINGDAKIEVAGGTVNSGLLDTSQWGGTFSEAPENTGTWLEEFQQETEEIFAEADILTIVIEGHRFRSYQLMVWLDEAAEWREVGAPVQGAGAFIEFQTPIDRTSAIYRVRTTASP